MYRGILISEQHGVNPCLPVCFWCGEEDGTVALLGKLKGDAEAPRHPTLSYDPCESCEAKFSSGVLLAEADERPATEGQPPIQEHPRLLYPTGRYFVVTEEWCKKTFDTECMPEVLEKRRAFIDPEVYQMMADAQISGEADE